MRKFLSSVALAAIAAAPLAIMGASAASATPVAQGQSWASVPVAQGQSWVALPSVMAATTSPYGGTYAPTRPTYSTGPTLPNALLNPDKNGNSRDAHTNGLSDMPPSIVTPHIVCFRVGGGFCWIPWVW